MIRFHTSCGEAGWDDQYSAECRLSELNNLKTHRISACSALQIRISWIDPCHNKLYGCVYFTGRLCYTQRNQKTKVEGHWQFIASRLNIQSVK